VTTIRGALVDPDGPEVFDDEPYSELELD